MPPKGLILPQSVKSRGSSAARMSSRDSMIQHQEESSSPNIKKEYSNKRINVSQQSTQSLKNRSIEQSVVSKHLVDSQKSKNSTHKNTTHKNTTPTQDMMASTYYREIMASLEDLGRILIGSQSQLHDNLISERFSRLVQAIDTYQVFISEGQVSKEDAMPQDSLYLAAVGYKIQAQNLDKMLEGELSKMENNHSHLSNAHQWLRKAHQILKETIVMAKDYERETERDSPYADRTMSFS